MVDALIGVLPIDIVKNISHALGNVAVGHAVGTGVRNIQSSAERPLERVQFRCLLLGSNKYTNKLILEGMYKLKFPIPFISRLIIFPFCIIDNLTFTQDSGRKDVEDNHSIIEFIITLVEYRTNIILKLASKFIWLAWTNATYPDKSTNQKLYPSIPSSEQEASIIVSEYIYSENTKVWNEDEVDEYNWTENELESVNKLNSKFSKIPFNADGIFPQVIKLIYPQSEDYTDDFNNEDNLPSDYVNDVGRVSKTDEFYAFPRFSIYQTKTIVLKLIPKMINDIINTTLIVEVDDSIVFERKIVSNKVYNISDYQIMFNTLEIKEENIQPENQQGGSYGGIINGGIRLK